MLNPVFTRIYFSDEEEANRADLVLRQVPRPRRDTLIANLAATRMEGVPLRRPLPG